jgi:hypothetical protein
VIDLRNVFDPPAMRKAGFAYHGIGRPQAAPAVPHMQPTGINAT